MATRPVAHTTVVRLSTLRIPHTPIQRLVRGPAMAWPMLVAASTSPAAAYEWWVRSTCSRKREGQHPEREARQQLGRHDPRHSARLQKAQVAVHEGSILVGAPDVGNPSTGCAKLVTTYAQLWMTRPLHIGFAKCRIPAI